jgi:hypothetical protein
MPATDLQKSSFWEANRNSFVAVEAALGIKPLIALTQSAEESNWGLSQLATEGLNIFSLTPGSMWLKFKRGEIAEKDVPGWSGAGDPTVSFPTTEYSKYPPNEIHYWEFPGDIVSKRDDGKGGSICTVDRYFRKYVSWAESIWDWARKITKEPLYEEASKYAISGDLKGYANALLKAGYATDPAYALNLINTGDEAIKIMGAM